MNETAKPRLSLILSVVAALLLCACSKAESESPPLQGARLGGPFTLTDHNGRQVSDRDFEGKHRLVYFGFTYCPDVCPVDLQTIGQGLRKLEKSDPAVAAQVQPIFITVDPQRDTPAVLKEYVKAFHPRLIGLTGSPDQIASVVKAHGSYFARQGEGGAKDYLVDHMRVVLLFGPKGEPIAIIPHDKGAEALASELKRWVEA
ncbi:MAG TPA: SCO family protein [Allosphingosinicella sp.]|nr:SCO family protein [Allosphingosinicella sp.]